MTFVKKDICAISVSILRFTAEYQLESYPKTKDKEFALQLLSFSTFVLLTLDLAIRYLIEKILKSYTGI